MSASIRAEKKGPEIGGRGNCCDRREVIADVLEAPPKTCRAVGVGDQV
jgi:hypothetical protein